MNMLKPTSDRKTRFRDAQRNTFGLYPGPAGDGTCPSATSGEGGCSQIRTGRKLPTCYVFNTINAYPAVGPALLHNTNLLRTADHTTKVALLTAEFARFHRIESKQDDPKMFYRLHWSGDIFDQPYATALSEAMRAFPDITFWNYTRSFAQGVWMANNTPNLIQYLSLDIVNFEAGMDIYLHQLRKGALGARLHICYMAKEDDYDERYSAMGELHRDWPLNPPVLTACPTDAGDLPLAGACSKCRKCLSGRNIWFKMK
jgi:hypothetical protein